MNDQSMIGVSALAILVVGMVVYRVVWFMRREKRRSSGSSGSTRESRSECRRN
jgi:heme/copper-type cytochrome/quinol oxidase subunit 2